MATQKNTVSQFILYLVFISTAALIMLAKLLSVGSTQYTANVWFHTTSCSRCMCLAANMPAPAPRLDQLSPSQGMPFAAHPYAPPVRLQSSDSIQIQMEPLQSMDSYAGRLMSPGMQVAIYSGRCPLLKLAAYQPPRATQQQACNPLS